MLTSANLCLTAFQSNTDSTRLQMASKQIQQALTHPNCEIPYVIGENYDKISNYSPLGLFLAEYDGSVVYKNNDLIIIKYDNDKIVVKDIQSIIKTHGIFASRLRFCLEQDEEFKKGDVIFEYDCFTGGIPSSGYNAFTAYNVWFGFNHEDSLVISEDFAEKAKVSLCEKIFIPIYEFTFLDPIYNNTGDFIYFPGINQRVKKNVLCQQTIPKTEGDFVNSGVLKNKVINLIKNMSLSSFNSMINTKAINNYFTKETIKTRIENGFIKDFKIHKLNNEKSLIDKRLQEVLNHLCSLYNKYIVEIYTDMTKKLSINFSKHIMKRNYIFSNNKYNKRADINVSDIIYLLEFTIVNEESTNVGDKLTNLYAGKGVCSLIIPNELRPIALTSNIPIDILFNPFGVYSRMNYGQLLNGSIAKTVMFCDKHIKSNPDSVKDVIKWLNDNIIYYLKEEKDYFNQVNELIKDLDDEIFKTKFLNNIIQNHLFIEGPCFGHTDIKSLQENWINPNEPLLIKKELIQYIKDKLKLKNDFVFTNDIVRNNIFCVPMYTQKLYKLTNHIINARDLGPVKGITQQPLKGRAQEGGSRLGQMEIEALLTNNCGEKVLKELLTVKSDFTTDKRNLIEQIITTGEYNIPKNIETIGRTRKVVSTILNFLKE